MCGLHHKDECVGQTMQDQRAGPMGPDYDELSDAFPGVDNLTLMYNAKERVFLSPLH